jgi:hypothetical protein
LGTTLDKIKPLEKMYLDGFGDEFMDRALDRLLTQQRTEDEAAMRVLRRGLDELVRK